MTTTTPPTTTEGLLEGERVPLELYDRELDGLAEGEPPLSESERARQEGE